ncbi:flagellar hook-basal body complex protein FliE [Mesobacillus harenae]|uniref:flagellar hook-basal body complex protein FliE n=1 Tax=Mesobacillus harenae TaxID=2213203 RepID=UPI00158102A6|nr:flagellar hook-basal body complex protein FliE [Mesobacillus harenae]
MNKVTFAPVTQIIKPTENRPTTPFEAQNNFASVLKDSISKLNEAQFQSDQMTEKLARGEKVDLHNVMITAQKASVSLAATMEFRNKAVEAYQEIMRMQV